MTGAGRPPRRTDWHTAADEWQGFAGRVQRTTDRAAAPQGGPADRAGLERLKARGHAGRHAQRGGVRMAKEEPRPTSRVCAGQTGFPSGGAEGAVVARASLLLPNPPYTSGERRRT